jgi:hypothetical protein
MTFMGEIYYKEVGGVQGDVNLVAVFPSLLDKTEGHRGAI